jgi:hypothetical protein
LAFPCIALAIPIPDTGQTKCYDNTTEITCPNPGQDFYGQDAQYISSPHSYTKLDENGNVLPDAAPWPWAMVRDNVTGLIWEVKTDDGSIHDRDNNYTWAEAMDFGTTLNAQNFGGYSDWRLPMIKELSSLVASSIPSPGPVMNIDYFPNAKSSHYWSSTDSVANENETWCVYFYNGVVYDWAVSNTFSVMAVRSGSSGNYVDNGDGTISDTDTGLMWQQDTASGFWQEALSYCDYLTLAEYNDWRLPNRNELQTIVDYSRDGPSIDITYFPSTASEFYWTSTTKAGYPGEAWCLSFLYGPVSSSVKSSAYNYLRCVRGAALVDSDADGISEDGDKSGTPGDNRCTGGELVNCDDNCPWDQNSMQEDSYPPGGNGCGDACECHADCNSDEKVNLTDLVTMKTQFFWKCSEHPTCEADCNHDGNVNLSDLVMMKSEFNRPDCPVCP